MKINQSGYTLPEVLVALILTGFFVGLIMTFTFSYWRYGASQEADMDTLTTRLNAGDGRGIWADLRVAPDAPGGRGGGAGCRDESRTRTQSGLGAGEAAAGGSIAGCDALQSA